MIPRCENLYSTMALRPTVDTCTRIYITDDLYRVYLEIHLTFRCWVQTSSNQENPKLSVYFMAVFVPLGLSFRAIKISWLKAYPETGAKWEGKEKNKIPVNSEPDARLSIHDMKMSHYTSDNMIFPPARLCILV